MKKIHVRTYVYTDIHTYMYIVCMYIRTYIPCTQLPFEKEVPWGAQRECGFWCARNVRYRKPTKGSWEDLMKKWSLFKHDTWKKYTHTQRETFFFSTLRAVVTGDHFQFKDCYYVHVRTVYLTEVLSYLSPSGVSLKLKILSLSSWGQQECVPIWLNQRTRRCT